MGNSVSAHIYETKVFRPYPVILYRLRLDPSIHWSLGMTKFGVKATGVPHGMTKFGVLGGKATVLVYMHDQIPI